MAFPQLRMIDDLCDSQIGHAYLMTQFRLRCSETPGKKCIPHSSFKCYVLIASRNATSMAKASLFQLAYMR